MHKFTNKEHALIEIVFPKNKGNRNGYIQSVNNKYKFICIRTPQGLLNGEIILTQVQNKINKNIKKYKYFNSEIWPDKEGVKIVVKCIDLRYILSNAKEKYFF